MNLQELILLSHLNRASQKKLLKLSTGKNFFATQPDFFNEQLCGLNVDLAREQAALENNQIKLINYFADNYPKQLKEMGDPPLILYALGNLNLLARPKVAIIGSRSPNLANYNLAAELSTYLAEQEITVVSGFARGIDTVAHQNATEHTVAVLGSGFGDIYPKENNRLFETLAESALLLTEYPYFKPPLKLNFPARNRIIAALADIIIVLEAKLNSGSMITARYGLEFGKDIFAVAGHPADSRVRGCNQLIKDGAHLLTDFREVAELAFNKASLKFAAVAKKPQQQIAKAEFNLSAHKQRVLNLLTETGLEIEILHAAIDLPIAKFNQILAELEIANLIYYDNFGRVCRRYNIS